MDLVSAFGSMVIGEGANAAMLVCPEPAFPAKEVPGQTTWTTEQQRQVDAAFVAHAVDATPSPALAALVVTACISAVKGVALDENGEPREDEEDREFGRKLLDEQPR